MKKELELGDAVEQALTLIGITQDRVNQYLVKEGETCKCDERKRKLNNISRWAKRVLRGKTEGAKEYLLKLTTEEEP